LKKRFNSADINSNGEISLEELMIYMNTWYRYMVDNLYSKLWLSTLGHVLWSQQSWSSILILS